MQPEEEQAARVVVVGIAEIHSVVEVGVVVVGLEVKRVVGGLPL